MEFIPWVEPPNSLVALANISVFLCCLYVFYLICKLFVPIIKKSSASPEMPSLSREASFAVLQNEVATLKGTVLPLTQLVGDVKVLLNNIEDLRVRVARLERP